MKLGWLWDSILNAAHQPSPRSTTPAFSPGGTITRSPLVGRRFKWTRDDLYEQCSDHITENTPSSTRFGSRPSSSLMRVNSSGVRLWAARVSEVIGSMKISESIWSAPAKRSGDGALASQLAKLLLLHRSEEHTSELQS